MRMALLVLVVLYGCDATTTRKGSLLHTERNVTVECYPGEKKKIDIDD